MTNFCYTFILVYFDANDNCNDLNFQFGSTLLGQAAKATRQFDIKISQISCKWCVCDAVSLKSLQKFSFR